MLTLNFSPYPQLKTDRLILRQLDASDAADLFALRSDENVNRYLNRPKATSVADVEAFMAKINAAIRNNQSLYWVITYHHADKLLGTICLWNIDAENHQAEIGYELLPDNQGKGIMHEALTTVLTYGIEQLKFNKILAGVHPENAHSIKLLLKSGFVQTNHPEQYIFMAPA